jgi:ubiquinone/menaquinone biosynthesis C-methylase UbiE
MTTTPQDRAAAEPTDIRNPFFVWLYDRVLQRGPNRKDTTCRRELLDGLSGTVVEVGPGKGPNFNLYPKSVERVIAVEPETRMRKLAEKAAAEAALPIDVVAGDAEHLPVADQTIDAVVLALVLCSVPDQSRALAEARRVLRPGGQLRIYEHVIARQAFPRTLQKAAQATFWPRAFGNCHPARDTLAAISAAGFDTSEIRRFVMQVAAIEPPMPYILGRATEHDPTAAA